jgi:1-aminocyclopropane-1-carboxylate deaminase
MAIELQDICIDYIREELLERAGVRLGILRLDAIHPLVSGNKWFKLKENIKLAQAADATTLLTFGGAFSNHLLAAAAAARELGLSSAGIVRGWHGRDNPSPTLQQCAALDMQLEYVSRETYQRKNDADYLGLLRERYPGAYIIPEGGDNEAGIHGAMAIAGYIPQDAHIVAAAIGTGTTFTGILKGLDGSRQVLGFPVMKGGRYLQEAIARQAPNTTSRWLLQDQYHFGGFARYTASLLAFMNRFYQQHGIPLDFVYTGKMIYGIFDMISKGVIPPGSHMIAVHTGGLQGNRSVSHLLAYS